MSCEHKKFVFRAEVARYIDIGKFLATAIVNCQECGKPFQFLGLPPGKNAQGAAVSVDGLELRIAICPQGERPSPMQLMAGIDQNKLN